MLVVIPDMLFLLDKITAEKLYSSGGEVEVEVGRDRLTVTEAGYIPTPTPPRWVYMDPFENLVSGGVALSSWDPLALAPALAIQDDRGMRSTVSRASEFKSRPLNDTTPGCPVVSVRHSERPLPHSSTLYSRKCCAATETHVCLERRAVLLFACGAIGLYVLAFAQNTRGIGDKDKLRNAVLDVLHRLRRSSCLRTRDKLGIAGFTQIYGPRCVDYPRRTQGDDDPHHHMSDVHVSRILRRCHRRGPPAKPRSHVFGRLCLVPPSDRTRIIADGAARRVENDNTTCLNTAVGNLAT